MKKIIFFLFLFSLNISAMTNTKITNSIIKNCVINKDEFLFENQDTSFIVSAYSTLKISKNYKGKCMRVRNANNVEVDIGFNGNIINEIELLNHTGRTNSSYGYVVKLYDQSGLNNDYINTIAASQPFIVFRGQINRLNQSPAVSFRGNQYLQSLKTLDDIGYGVLNIPVEIMAVCMSTRNNSTEFTFLTSSTGATFELQMASNFGTSYYGFRGMIEGVPFNDVGNPEDTYKKSLIASLIFNGSKSYVRLNQLESAPQTELHSGGAYYLVLGRRTTSGLYFYGSVGTILYFKKNLTLDQRSRIENFLINLYLK